MGSRVTETKCFDEISDEIPAAKFFSPRIARFGFSYIWLSVFPVVAHGVFPVVVWSSVFHFILVVGQKHTQLPPSVTWGRRWNLNKFNEFKCVREWGVNGLWTFQRQRGVKIPLCTIEIRITVQKTPFVVYRLITLIPFRNSDTSINDTFQKFRYRSWLPITTN